MLFIGLAKYCLRKTTKWRSLFPTMINRNRLLIGQFSLILNFTYVKHSDYEDSAIP